VTTVSLPFSAVLLAGGKSARMGFDKAGLVIEGQPLWQRQLATLRALEPRELFISGRPDGPYMGADVPIVFDAEPGLGPIGGLAAALRQAQHPYLLVLAVDLPAMTSGFLRGMVETAIRQDAGLVPCVDDRFEPLAAVYPQKCLSVVEEILSSGADRSLQGFLAAAVTHGIFTCFSPQEAERSLFQNLNAPDDLGLRIEQPEP